LAEFGHVDHICGAKQPRESPGCAAHAEDVEAELPAHSLVAAFPNRCNKAASTDNGVWFVHVRDVF
jgi:hypothetical protein